jgi:flagellar protein FliO/FliZ
MMTSRVLALFAALFVNLSFCWSHAESAPEVALQETAAVAPVAAPVAPTVMTPAVPETEIPVKLEAAKKAEAAANPWMRMTLGMVVVGLMAGTSWYLMKKKTLKLGKPEVTPEVKILAKHYLGPKKELFIVRIAGESMLLGVTDSSINLIKSLSLLDEDIPEEVPQSFAQSLKKQTGTNPEKNESAKEDDFSISEIASVVSSKLRNSRMIQ